MSWSPSESDRHHPLVQARIDLSALRHNVSVVRSLAPDSRILGMVKASAYGHGFIEVSRALAENHVDALGVARFEEALRLRRAGLRVPVVIFSSSLTEEMLRLSARSNFIPVVHTQAQIETVGRLKYTLPYWVEINTGMNRLGLSSEEFFKHVASAQNNEFSISPSVVMMHFACADEQAHPLNDLQWHRFLSWTSEGAFLRSAANSAALWSRPETQLDWVRPGISLYGISPFRDRMASDLGLKSVMQLEAAVIAVHALKPEDNVGYGAWWSASKATRIAILAIGYGDGYPRVHHRQACVLLHGVRCPVVGCVSMDSLAVDIGNLPVCAGDRAILWGQGLAIEEVAQSLQTIPYTLCTGLTLRVPRLFVESSSDLK